MGAPVISKALAYVIGAVAALALVLGIYGATRSTSAPWATTLGSPAPAPGPAACSTSPGDGGLPVCPSSWSQAAWFVDPNNSSGCASDSNVTCGQSTCTSGVPGIADGPCLSYTQITNRWGTLSPRILQNTIITAMSSDNGDTDVWYAGPFSLEKGAGIEIAGTLTTVQATTLSAVTAKNRSTPQLLQVTFAAGSLAAGQLVVNTTHASRAWIYKNVSGNTWLMTQPGTASNQTVPTLRNCNNPTEVDTWAVSDVVTVYTVPQINLAYAGAVVQGESSSTFGNGFTLYQIGVRAPTTTSGFAPMTLGGLTEFIESASNIPVFPIQSGSLGALGNGFVNSSIAAGVLANIGSSLDSTNVATGIITPLTCYSAGYFGTGTTWNLTPTMGTFTQDTILAAGSNSLINVVYAGIESVYLDGGKLTITGRGDVNSNAGAAGGPYIWGTGTINATGTGRIFYPTGAGGAAASLLASGGIQLNGKTVGCYSVPADAAAPTCNNAITASGMDSAFGTLSGCVFNPGGGSFCNYGP